MKNYSLYVLTLFLFLTSKVYTQESFLSLGQELTKINEKHLDDSFEKTFENQDSDSYSEIHEDMAKLQVAHIDLKSKVNQYLSEKIQCNNIIETNPPKEKEKDKGHWEIVLAVVASGERDQSSQLILGPPIEHHGFDELLMTSGQDELMDLFHNQIQDMNEDEIINYISYIATKLPYNFERAEFKKDHNRKGLGLFDILNDQKKADTEELDEGTFGGICGDIHYALGELINIANNQGKMNCEYVTMSYTAIDTAHVIGGCAKENGDFLVLNYGEARVVSNPNGVSSIQAGIGTSSMPDIGSRVRIFGHTEKGANHIATLKNEVGSFLYSMNLRKDLQSVSPLYENHSNLNLDLNNNKTKEYTSKGQAVTKEINQGMRFYSGRLQNSQEIFGVAVYREANKKKGSTVRSTSNSLSANKTDFKNFDEKRSPLNLYFLHHYGVQKTLIQKDGFQLIGEIAEQVEINSYFVNGKPTSVDGDLNINTKVQANYRLPNNRSQLGLEVASNHAIGLKDQRNIYNFNEIHKNIKLTPNAIRAAARFTQQLDNDKSISTQASVVTTQVGTKYDIITAFTNDVHQVYIKYENSGKGLYGTHNMNLLPNSNSGIEAGAATALTTSKRKIEVNAKARYDFNFGSFIGAGVKLKLNKPD